jgi:predicted methyltransferase
MTSVVIVAATTGASAQDLDPATSRALVVVIAGEHRSDRNRARDTYRHPRDTLAFFGLRSDMTVVEIWPGGGWYTEILAPALRGTGKLYVAEYGASPSFDYQRAEMETLAGKFERWPDVYGEVTQTSLGFPDRLEIAPPGTADLVLTFRNVHNWFDPNYGADPAHAKVLEARMTEPGRRRVQRTHARLATEFDQIAHDLRSDVGRVAGRRPLLGNDIDGPREGGFVPDLVERLGGAQLEFEVAVVEITAEPGDRILVAKADGKPALCRLPYIERTTPLRQRLEQRHRARVHGSRRPSATPRK